MSVRIRKPPPTAVAALRFKKLYIEGKSLTEISNICRTAVSTVRLSLLRSGVTLRTTTEALALVAEKLSRAQRGKKRTFSVLHKKNISLARKKSRKARGWRTSTNGYLQFTRGYFVGMDLHYLIAAMMLGRPLDDDEVVHHIDGNKVNNHPSNLEVLTKSEHARVHAIDRNKTRGRDGSGRFLGVV